MPTCSTCGRPITYRELFLSFWRGYAPITCPQCFTVHQHTNRNRLLGAIAIGVAVITGWSVRVFTEWEWVLPILTVAVVGIALSGLIVFFFSVRPAGVDVSS